MSVRKRKLDEANDKWAAAISRIAKDYGGIQLNMQWVNGTKHHRLYGRMIHLYKKLKKLERCK